MTATDAAPVGRMPSPSGLRIIPARYWGQRLGATLLMAVVLGFAALVASSRNVQWDAIGTYLFDPTILDGIQLTLVFTVLAMAISILAGIVLAMMRLASNPILSGFAAFYIWFFRGTPLLVQIIFWFNIQLFIPAVDIGPLHVETNTLISAFTAALLALSLNESAYVAEIVRGGLLAVDKGQTEAATALGYTPFQTLTRIVLPQALRVIIPPIGNQTISMLKTTSLVSVVAAQDLLTRVQNIYAKNFLIIELLIVASIWYLVLTTAASLGQAWIERRLARSDRGPSKARRILGAAGRQG
ncbi:amino acid ABC transporter permease [Inquilinus limosus]|uniref:amino acid ABC transporter permease n=1 Tax=Inquilinus limosus TaxID=171674 RepID=UPI00054CE492|nr:amino acid ABC transporter permease [Inquilinus limosus]